MNFKIGISCISLVEWIGQLELRQFCFSLKFIQEIQLLKIELHICCVKCSTVAGAAEEEQWRQH